MANSKFKTKKKKVVRRGKNEGSVYQRNDGRWCAVVSLVYDSDGKRVRKIFYGWTRSEVAMKMTAALGENQRRSRFRHQRRFADIHRHEDDIPAPYASERIGAVQAPLPFLAAHLFEYAVRVARKPESHPDAARSQRRHNYNPHLQQRRPLLLQASRRQTRLEIPLRRRLKLNTFKPAPIHSVPLYSCLHLLCVNSYLSLIRFV